MYDRILVPTDGSDVAEAATRQAVDLAVLCAAELHALSVVDAEAVGFVQPTDLDVDEVRTALRREGEEATAAVARLGGDADVEVVQQVRVGVPAEAILDYVEDEDVDLVVMGTHGRSGLARFLLGSVAERVLRAAPVPVLVVPPRGIEPLDDVEDSVEPLDDVEDAVG